MSVAQFRSSTVAENPRGKRCATNRVIKYSNSRNIHAKFSCSATKHSNFMGSGSVLARSQQHSQVRSRGFATKVQASVVAVGDIGGTNARLSLWTTQGPTDGAEIFAKTYQTEGNPTFEGVMEQFLNEEAVAKNKPQSASLAIAGAIDSNRCKMTNCHWLVDGPGLESHFGFRVALLNDFEAVGYGVMAVEEKDVVIINPGKPKLLAPKVVMGPGTGLGAAQMMWDEGQKAYKVWPGEGAHATFAPRGWKQRALAEYAGAKFGGHVEIEHVACGSGLEIIYEFLLTDEAGNRPHLKLGTENRKSAKEITAAALAGQDALAVEAVDMFMNIVGAEAGAMSLRCLARGGVLVAGGITPRLLPHLQKTGGGALLEGFLCRKVREPFNKILQDIPLSVVTNEKVGQIGARECARRLVESQ